MTVSFETVYDLINLVKIKASEDELTTEEALELLEKELSDIEYDD